MHKLMIILALFLFSGLVRGFDHGHITWNTLLKEHVQLINEGNASQLDYSAMLTDHSELKNYLGALSSVNRKDYEQWTTDQQLSFLINAYNAFTVDMILKKYPKIDSIKDLGSFFRSPWKKRFFTLLEGQRSLDELENELIRAPEFSEPRIHFAINCASVGCPMLRNEAFTAIQLDAQLADNMRRFLSDTTRNRFDTSSGKMQLSKIFDWYEDDFRQEHEGVTSLENTLAKHAELLAHGSVEIHQRIVTGDYMIIYLDYDWLLNDVRG